MSFYRSLLIVAGALAFALPSNAAGSVSPNLLADPSFESGTAVPDGIGGWKLVDSAAFSQDYAFEGARSTKMDYDPASMTFTPNVYQFVPGTAGLDYTLAGRGFTPDPLVSSVGLMTLFFSDSNFDTILYNTVLISAASPANTWILSSVTLTAPPGTAYVGAQLLLAYPTPGTALYWDDMSLTVVPEPSGLAVLALGASALLAIHRRR